MDDEARKSIVREKLKKANGGKKEIAARYHPKYPDSVEREYIRLCNSYMAIEKQVLMKYLPELKKIISEGSVLRMDSASDNNEGRKKARFENVDNTIRRLRILFDIIRKELDSTFGLYHLAGELNRIANLGHKLSVKEWKKTVWKTLGINLLEDYYSGEFYQEMLEKWVSDNVDLIKTIPADSLGKMKEIVYKNYMDGSSTTSIIKEIQRQYGTDKRHARFIARDQTAKLNAAITQHQQRDAGIRRYEWSDSGDRRVRKSHQKLHGRIFSWDDPPETDHGRRCHPGEDYQCRCCAIPVFDMDELDLPV